jgi:membrane fusion protein (multidrug efflux system)
MSSPFSRTTRSLKADSFRRSTIGLLVVMLVLAAWAAWLVLARVSIYETTGAARLEVEAEVQSIESHASGRVVVTNLVMGREVKAGDLLLELDSDPQRLQLGEEESRISALASQLTALRGEIGVGRQSLDQTRQATPVALDEARAKYNEAETEARQRMEEAERFVKLHRDGLISEIVLLRARADAEKARAASDALRLAVARLEKDQGVRETDQQSRVAALLRQVATLEGEMATRAATVERLRNEIERRIVRAPASGRLGQVAKLPAGSVVREGDKLGAVIPPGRLKAVAEFAPSAALGRIRAGQPARMRLEGFPWTEYGGVPATVSSVSAEPRDGRIRVELLVEPDPASPIPFQHGLPGTIEVEVEQVSPATLVLRAAGRRLTGIAGSSSKQ